MSKFQSTPVSGRIDHNWMKRLNVLLERMHINRYKFVTMAVKDTIVRLENANKEGNGCSAKSVASVE